MISQNSKSSSTVSPEKPLSAQLERLYSVYNKPCFIHPDPLELILPYARIEDREIAALIASSLAYGRVAQILKSAGTVLHEMGDSPFRYIIRGSTSRYRRDFAGFKHRFHTGEDLACLFEGIRNALREFDSLENCFLSGDSGTETAAARESAFVRKLCRFFPDGESTLLPSPERGSACKRLNLMLRWLVRSDAVDPGGWTRIQSSSLMVPLDTHMHRLARDLGLTARNAADWKTAEEVTIAFSKHVPEDPARYDFALTRFGIHPDFCRNPFQNPL